MTKVNIAYQGHLRTICTHENSGQQFETDAPQDNNGKGERFSPTDLLATAYASCMITVIGIFCDQHSLEFKNGTASVEKIMTDNPRRIKELIIEMDLRDNNWSKKEQQKISAIAKNCPVAKSVDPEIITSITFKF